MRLIRGRDRPLRSLAHRAGAAILSLTLFACTDAAGPDGRAAQCTDDTGSVAVTVEGASFDWSPACHVALFLIEDGASDMWGVSTDEGTWQDPAAANRISPPVTYGEAPAGAQVFQDARLLESGRTYEVVLWRVLRESSTATCIQRFETLCLVAVHEFTM